MISIIFSDLSRDFSSIVQMYQFVIFPIFIKDGYQYYLAIRINYAGMTRLSTFFLQKLKNIVSVLAY